jgi:hypothetical protein
MPAGAGPSRPSSAHRVASCRMRERPYIEVESGYDRMLNYAPLRESENKVPSRKPYNLLTHSCVHFALDVVAAAEIETPWSFDPRPSSYIGEFQDEYPDLDYNPRTGELKVELEAEAA